MCRLIKCLFGFHKYEVYKEEQVSDYKGNIIGKVIISRCSECGKLKNHYVETVKY